MRTERKKEQKTELKNMTAGIKKRVKETVQQMETNKSRSEESNYPEKK